MIRLYHITHFRVNLYSFFKLMSLYLTLPIKKKRLNANKIKMNTNITFIRKISLFNCFFFFFTFLFFIHQ